MISFKQFLLNESIFTIIDYLCDDPSANITRLAALWVFYKTNQRAAGIIALHRFYEPDDTTTENIFMSVAQKQPNAFKQALQEVQAFIDAGKILKLKQTLRQYFLAKKDDKDILPQMKQGPRLPSKPVTTFIKPKSRSFG